MKPLKRLMDIRFLQALRVDWKYAMKEIETLMNTSMADSSMPLEDKLKSVELFKETSHFYNNDDMDNYMPYLDEHYTEIKPNMPFIFTQPYDERIVPDHDFFQRQ